jgi:hypothetical protein
MVSGGIDPPLLTPALDGSEGSASSPGRFTPKDRIPGIHWIRGWVGPTAGIDAVEIEENFLPLPTMKA